MIKDARLTVGRTLTEMSGRPCDRLVEAEPRADDEPEHPDPGLKAAAAQLKPLVGEEGE